MSLFAIADTHLSFGVDKPMKIFPGWAGFEQRLEKNWRALVDEKDTVVIAGDISWAMTLNEAVLDFRFLHQLPGEKIILKGNHDYWWTSKKKMDDFLADNKFDSIKILHNSALATGPITVCGTRGWPQEGEEQEDKKVLLREAGRLQMSIDAAKKMGGEPMVFLHYPPATVDSACDEFVDILAEEKIKHCYFGHLHAQAMKNFRSFEYRGIQFDLISSDYLGFCPKLIQNYQ
jgi:predicted phosphohydrolase